MGTTVQTSDLIPFTFVPPFPTTVSMQREPPIPHDAKISSLPPGCSSPAQQQLCNTLGTPSSTVVGLTRGTLAPCMVSVWPWTTLASGIGASAQPLLCAPSSSHCLAPLPPDSLQQLARLFNVSPTLSFAPLATTTVTSVKVGAQATESIFVPTAASKPTVAVTTTTTHHSKKRKREADHPDGEHPRFACALCSVAFASRFSLRRHKKVHTGERPHVCAHPGCGKAFGERSTLRRHRMTHTGEKPYKCRFPLCDRAFADRANIQRHEASHRV